MTRLSVNVHKMATLRNARGTDVPNLLQLSRDILRFGVGRSYTWSEVRSFSQYTCIVMHRFVINSLTL